ncbi:MAG: acetyl/propionyl/methylcrotonyl-CoA carboxylase subunit alpha [Alphaproteobacteria bacterium]|nr:acetyl/propionyl/methylcrotonyl-CoA carboxylase subunit alpha [Alphaproteobacteria bacterium]
MFKKILIANRGEIACRVIKTARKMGIRTVAVYSDADREALHVRMADEKVNIGAGPANQSYLLADRIIAACKQTGAEAVHPGYGFLSENAGFCARLNQAGIVFIGPPVKAIEAMGDKITSKKIAAAAGVSTVPGSMGLIADADEAVKIAGEVGYPVMIKASAGGGGKGMRVAWNDGEAREGFERSKSEAASAFGDDHIFIEKFVTNPRHIEIQVLGDGHGNAIYLGERECSIQRRNQKVIEEAPSPFLDDKTRKAMGAEAVALARAVGYTSAGTVEFIVDDKKHFYFLEMNTRLQVEHPVTELITGLDLVELMLRVAAGEKLPLTQDEVKLDGWAIESRLYAEDPYRNFLPSVGRLVRYRPPEEGEDNGIIIRNDTGVFEGGEISTFYDPMIAKLCTWAETREKAINAMEEALDSFEVEGVGHNLPFLSAVMGQARFREGRLTTGYIAEEFPDGFSGAELSDERRRELLAAAVVLHVQTEHFRTAPNERDTSLLPSAHETPFVSSLRDMAVICGTCNEKVSVRAEHTANAVFVTFSDGQIIGLAPYWKPGETVASLYRVEGTGRLRVKVDAITGGFRLRHGGADLNMRVVTPRTAELMKIMPVKLPPDLSKYLLCPMPGQIVRLEVTEGQVVEAGQVLVIVEAMKMENVLRAEKRARIEKLNVAVGSVLAVDEVILEFGEA